MAISNREAVDLCSCCMTEGDDALYNPHTCDHQESYVPVGIVDQFISIS